LQREHCIFLPDHTRTPDANRAATPATNVVLPKRNSTTGNP
jgi:hypothetical protein